MEHPLESYPDSVDVIALLIIEHGNLLIKRLLQKCDTISAQVLQREEKAKEELADINMEVTFYRIQVDEIQERSKAIQQIRLLRTKMAMEEQAKENGGSDDKIKNALAIMFKCDEDDVAGHQHCW